MLLEATLVDGFDSFYAIDTHFVRTHAYNRTTSSVSSFQHSVLSVHEPGIENPAIRERTSPVRGGDLSQR